MVSTPRVSATMKSITGMAQSTSLDGGGTRGSTPLMRLRQDGWEMARDAERDELADGGRFQEQ